MAEPLEGKIVSPVGDNAPAPEAIRRSLLGTVINAAGQLLPNGGEVWALDKPDGVAKLACRIQGDALVLIFSGEDKYKVAQMLGFKLPGGK